MARAECQPRFFGGKAPFSLRQELEKTLHLSVHALLNEIPNDEYSVTSIGWIWMAGGICSLLSVALYPLAFQRTKLFGGKHWCLIPCFLAVVSHATARIAWKTMATIC